MNSHRDQENIYLHWDTGELDYLLAALYFSEAFPCDMFQGECSYLLSSPLCIVLLLFVLMCHHSWGMCSRREREKEEHDAVISTWDWDYRVQKDTGGGVVTSEYSIMLTRTCMYNVNTLPWDAGVRKWVYSFLLKEK